MSKVTIVIPCYNQAHYVEQAIISALFQTVKCEVIVVNDGSTDNTHDVCCRYPITLVEKENGGLASARNSGIAYATGDYILPLDADDMIRHDFIEQTLGKDDIVATQQQEFGDTWRLWTPNQHPTFNDFLSNNKINCCSLYKKEVWERVGGYDQSDLMRNGYEDWLFWGQATRLGYHISVINLPLFYYRKHGVSLVNNAVAHHDELKAYIQRRLCN